MTDPAAGNGSMRTIVIGGAGEVGSALTRDLAGCAEVQELVIADIDAEAASALASEIDRPGVTAAALDIGDRRGALQLLERADVLMNCTPFAQFDRVIALAIEAGVNYADLISEPTDGQRRAAERAGITAISGLGLTPGLSNVLAAHAAAALDTLDEIHVSWVSLRTIAPTPGGLDTILWECSEDCRTRQFFQNGRFERAAPHDGGYTVEFAAPVGKHRVYLVPHPEVVTLPRNFPSLRFCAVRGTWRPEIMEDIRVLNKYGLLGDDAIETTKALIWERYGGVRDDAPWPLFMNMEVIGSRDGDVLKRTYDVSHPIDWGQAGMARITGTCAAVGAQLLGRHGRHRVGFVDPEVYYDPSEFLAELRGREGVSVEWREETIGGAPATSSLIAWPAR